MKKYIVVIGMVFLFSCKELYNCEEKVCTLVFVSIGVTYKNSANEFVEVEGFKVYNTRTNTYITEDVYKDPVWSKGRYVIISDASLGKLSEKGDKLIVSAKNPVTNTINETEFVISGGNCNCHVEKIAGPDEIILQ
ncbi:hypothetical protein [Pedobacter puniceum]|uniref:Uncharacterized protein n=1 Tax=Pedobacter puniceum TaxID=2666136 RepID=A0A7K0FIP1_9SPHI|nr:hypothetical protein [Pedobacter puniceum]MRX45846.1 hypothetical protein [Pedobacter puniceum]